MSPAQTRRPALATSFSRHNIFCRPIIPPPAPVVYVNGWDGVGKGTVSECLTLLLGKDKSFLIDVRSVGWDSFEDGRCGGTAPRTSDASHHRNKQQHEHHPHFLLTPEHPRYSSFETDYGVNSIASPSLSSLSSPSPINQSASRPTSIYSSTSTSSGGSSLITTAAAAATTTTTKKVTMPTTAEWPTTTTTTVTTPCSSENLTLLLSHPSNRDRIAVLPTCAPDTPGGRATLRTFEAAASRAGRLFVPVALTCSPAAHARRIRGGSFDGEGSGSGSGSGGAAVDSGLGSGGGGMASGMMSLHLHRRRPSEGSGGPRAFFGCSGECCRGSSGSGPHHSCEGYGGNGPDRREEGGGERRKRRVMSVPGPEIGTGPRMGLGMGVGWAKGQGLATPMSTKGLTMDVTSVTPFEAALQIVEFVRGLQAELDAELSSMGESTEMPADRLDRLKRENR